MIAESLGRPARKRGPGALYQCLETTCVDALETKILLAEIADVGASPAGIPVALFRGASYSGVLGSTQMAAPFPLWVTDEAAGNRDSLPHEILHALGFQHTNGCGAAGADPYPVEPPNILGVGVNRSLSTVGGIGPIMSGSGSEPFFDLMGYCRPRWLSVRTWERLVTRLATGTLPAPATATSSSVRSGSARASVARATAPLATVTAVLVDGKPVIDEVETGYGSFLKGSPSHYSLVGFRSGHAHARVTMSAITTEPDATTARPSGEILRATLPLRDAASLQIQTGGHTLARLSVPKRLRLTLPERAACFRRGIVTVRYHSNAGRGAFLHARLLAGRGSHFATVEMGGEVGSISVASAHLPKGTNHLRLTIDNGFSQATATLALHSRC
jgi:hypothetical protein